MPDVIAEVITEFLQAFADAWNRHDIDALMTFMTEDCVFEASAGPEVCGTRYAGGYVVIHAVPPCLGCTTSLRCRVRPSSRLNCACAAE